MFPNSNFQRPKLLLLRDHLDIQLTLIPLFCKGQFPRKGRVFLSVSVHLSTHSTSFPLRGLTFSPRHSSHERRKQNVPQKNPGEVPCKPNSRARRCGPCDARAALFESPQLQAKNLAPEGPAPLPTYLRAVGYSHLAKKQRAGPCPACPKRECSAYRGQHSEDSACRAKK